MGPLPQAQRGCSVAAPRCRRMCRGVAVAIPPPLDSWGLPVFVKECMPISARPRSRSCRRGVRGCSITTPFMWSPTTSGLGRPLGVGSKIVPQPLPRRVLRVTQRRCGSAGGAVGGFAAVTRVGPRTFPRLKCSRHGAHRYCSRCNALTGACCGRCLAPRRRAPWPLAGNSDTFISVDGRDSITSIPRAITHVLRSACTITHLPVGISNKSAHETLAPLPMSLLIRRRTTRPAIEGSICTHWVP